MTNNLPDNTGKIYIVSTPIGNLKDITLRALEILSTVELIAAEDTRKASILLNHYDIRTKTTSYYDYNKEKKTPALIAQLKSGNSIAIISDAGTPGISDPAFYLVRAALQQGIDVEAIPGPTAFVPALVISGLPTDRFIFEGFLPTKKGRQTKLNVLKEEKRTIIIYESPRRIMKTLNNLHEAFGNRRVSVARELTKKFEQVYRGELGELCSKTTPIKQKGEFVIIIEGRKDRVKSEKN